MPRLLHTCTHEKEDLCEDLRDRDRRHRRGKRDDFCDDFRDDDHDHDHHHHHHDHRFDGKDDCCDSLWDRDDHRHRDDRFIRRDHRRCHDHCDCRRCRHRRKKRDLIPVGRISVDCTPVRFDTPGQAKGVISCAVDQVVNVPVTRTINVQVPDNKKPGCFFCVPVTETVLVPVTTTVKLPPIRTPVPRLVCPPRILCPCPSPPTKG